MANLVPVNNPRPGQVIQCCRCFRMAPADQIMADLDGPAFKAYYCRSCVWIPSNA
jgi:late competence protein required for DNA uptake (superfamily II DNA/RNA helicase)